MTLAEAWEISRAHPELEEESAARAEQSLARLKAALLTCSTQAQAKLLEALRARRERDGADPGSR